MYEGKHHPSPKQIPVKWWFQPLEKNMHKSNLGSSIPQKSLSESHGANVHHCWEEGIINHYTLED